MERGKRINIFGEGGYHKSQGREREKVKIEEESGRDRSEHDVNYLILPITYLTIRSFGLQFARGWARPRAMEDDRLPSIDA